MSPLKSSAILLNHQNDSMLHAIEEELAEDEVSPNDIVLVDQDNVEELYTELDRPLGHGPIRVGSSFKLQENMYSLMFIAYSKPEYKQACEHAAQEALD